MKDLIERQAAINETLSFLVEYCGAAFDEDMQNKLYQRLILLPSAQPEYEPVTAEDFAKTMAEYTVYRYMAWHGEALVLMKEQGFVICKKTM